MAETRESPARNLWISFWDFIFPRSCCICDEHLVNSGGLLCETCLESIPVRPNSFCVVCKHDRESEKPDHACEGALDSVYALSNFEGGLQTLIHKFKYERKLSLGRLLSQKLSNQIAKFSSTHAFDVVIPVPLHSARKRERGFNQSEVLGEVLSNQLKAELDLWTLVRHRNTKDQTRLDVRQRRQNVSDAFRVKGASAIRGKSILLVDDVITTGATLNECARVLKESGAGRISACTLARAV